MKINAELATRPVQPLPWLVVILVLIGLTLVPALALSSQRVDAQSPNLLVNPGFENGSTGWLPSPDTNFSFSITTTVVHSGTHSAALTGSGSSATRFISQTITGITPGVSYSLSGYGLIQDANVSSITLQMEWHDTANCSGTAYSTPVTSNRIITPGAFKLLSIPSAAAPSTVHCVRIQARFTTAGSAAGTAFFDDLVFSADTSATFTPTATATITPTSTLSPTVPIKLYIVEVLYDGTLPNEGDEFVSILNSTSAAVPLEGYKIGDEETQGGNEGMYSFPVGSFIPSNSVLVIARNAAQFRARFGFDPNYELVTSGVFTDTLTVRNLTEYKPWATGSLQLTNTGDEVLLLGPDNQIVDSVAWGNGDFVRAALSGEAEAPAPLSLQRYGSQDTDNMTFDFARETPHPGSHIAVPPFPSPRPPAPMPGGMWAFWGDLHAHSTVSGGSAPPRMVLAQARSAGLHFAALTDHDDEIAPAEWSELGSAVSAATVNGAFVALRGFEYTHPTQGHVNIYNTDSFVAHDNLAYDTLTKMYVWLANQPNAIAQFNHPEATYGNAFQHFALNAAVLDKMVLQEVGNSGNGVYARYENEYPASLSKRWHVAPSINSDEHGSLLGADSPHRVGVIAPALTTANLLDALRARRVFATEDNNLALALQSNSAWMGSTIPAATQLTFTVTASDPDAEPLRLELYDNGAVAWSQSFPSSTVNLTFSVAGSSSHFYYLRAVQSDGDIAYTAPIWTDDTPLPTVAVESGENKKDLGPVSIATARTTALDRYVSLTGCVTVPPGVFSDRYIYIQDATAGIRLYLYSAHGNFPPLEVGHRISVRGRVRSLSGERTVEIEELAALSMAGTCSVRPTQYAAAEINGALEGMLVQVTGTLSGAGTTTDNWVLSDSAGRAPIYRDPTTGIRTSAFARGQQLAITGIVTHARSQSMLTPRFASDIVSISLATPTVTRTVRPTTASTRLATRYLTPTLTGTPPPSPTEHLVFRRPTIASAVAVTEIDGRAFAAAGGSASLVGGGLLFAVGLFLVVNKKPGE